jgi:hypothetical protein
MELSALAGVPGFDGGFLPFDAAMDLLSRAGLPTAPYHVVDVVDDEIDPGFDGPYVVKLADLAHRTEHNAVLLGVDACGLHGAVAKLRAMAREAGLPERVAVQPLLSGHGEAFIGLRGDTGLGPLVVFGVGGIFVEVLRRVGGRIAPFDAETADTLLGEFDDLQLFSGFRGRPAWDRQQLGRLLVAAGDFIAAARHAIVSVDINPIIAGEDGYVAVDALVEMRSVNRGDG